MKLFTLECESCEHTWHDIYKTYMCPRCLSLKVKMLDQAGQSLVGVLVAAAITSFLMLTSASIANYAFKSNTTATVNSDVVGYIDQLRNNLRDPVLASVALSSNNVKNSATIYDPLSPANVIAQAGYKQQPNYAWQVSQVNFDSVQAIPSRVGLYRITISITIKKDQKRTIGAQFSKRVIGDVYCMVNSNIITSCYGAVDTQTLSQQLCTSIGATWNTTAGTCSISSTCSGNDNGNHTGENH